MYISNTNSYVSCFQHHRVVYFSLPVKRVSFRRYDAFDHGRFQPDVGVLDTMEHLGHVHTTIIILMMSQMVMSHW